MKRLAQFVVLIAVALISAHPALGYMACSSGSCSETNCPAACCGDMPGMDHMAAVHLDVDCSAMMVVLPGGPGCGLPSSSTAAIAREAAATALAGAGDRNTSFFSPPAFTQPASACAGSVAAGLAPERRLPIDRGVLLHVFRI